MVKARVFMGLQAPLPDRSGSPLIHCLDARRLPARAGIEVNVTIDRVASGATVFALEFALRPVMLGRVAVRTDAR